MYFLRLGTLLVGFGVLGNFASAQSTIKLIPMPREIRATSDQALPHGVRIVCAAPCAAEDQFAADDLAMTLQTRGIQAASATGISD